MIRKLLGVILAATLLPVLAHAQSYYVVRDGNGSLLEFGSYAIGSINYPVHIDAGLASGVPTPLTITSGGLNVNCVAGCTGGGGGGSNAAAGATGAAVPGFASYTGLIVPGGLLKGWAGDSNGFADVNVENFPSTQAVTGTFWQTTQPVSLASLPALSAGSATIGDVGIIGSVGVTGTFWQATQPISAASLPLPSGASTAALQPALNGDGGALEHVTNFPSSYPVTGTFWQATQPVSAASLPLPSGAATSALQTTGNTSLTSLAGAVSGSNLNVICTSGCSGSGGGNAAAGLTGSVVPTSASYTGLNFGGNLKGWTGDTNGYGDVNVENFPSTQAVTGTFWQTTQPVSAASLPLPTGASTAAGLTTINTTLGSPFQAGASIGNTSFASTQSGTWNITNVSGTITLPTGASTSALQTSGNTSLTTLASSVGATGSAVPADAGYTGLNFGGNSKGWVGDTNGYGDVNVMSLPALPTGANTIGAISNTSFAATQSGTWNITNVSGTVSLPTGAATSANQTNASQKTQIVDGSGNVIASTSNNLNVQCANCSGAGASATDEASFTAGTSVLAPTGGFFQTTATSNPLSTGQQGMVQMTANRALFSNLRNASGTEVGTSSTPLQVSLANTGSNGTAVAVSAASLPLPTGAATAANQTNVQAAAGSSSSSVMGVQGVSGGLAIPVSGTFWQTTQPVSGTVTANAGTGTSTTNVSQFGGSAVATGTGAGGSGIPRVTVSNDSTVGLVAGSALVGKVGIDQTTPGTTNAVQNIGGASGGSTSSFAIAANSTNSTNVKGSAGTVYHVHIFNNSANIGYLKFYNKATAPTCGTDTVVDQVMVPGITGGTGAVMDIALGENFSTGIGYCLTGGIGGSDTTAVAANAFSVTLLYK